MRRNRRTAWSRALVRENTLTAHDLIWPVFVIEGQNRTEAVASMPGVTRYSVDLIIDKVKEAADLGIPAVALFPPGKFLAMAAAILYAAPVAIKIAADGIRSVAPPTVEAATSIGSSRWQMIGKVQLPMAKGSMVLAANQGLLFVLSMVVIGALVGGGSLGYLVISGFAQGELYGKGLAAGIAITALGIMLDRITVHTAARYGRAENE